MTSEQQTTMEHGETESYRQAVRAFIVGHVGDDELGDDTDLFASGLVSSLFAVQIVVWIERTCGVRVAPEDLDIDNFTSIDAITEFLRLRRGAVDGG